MSFDGRYTVFNSQYNPITRELTAQRVYRYDRELGLYEPVSVETDVSPQYGSGAKISDDGRYVVYQSIEPLRDGIWPGWPKIYRRDMSAGSTELIDVGYNGNPGNYYSYSPDISGDGRYVSFGSFSDNLVPGDAPSNPWRSLGGDVFVRDVDAQTTILVTTNNFGPDSRDTSTYGTSISGNGRFIAFSSNANNLVANDLNNFRNIFLYDRDPDENGIFGEGNAALELVSMGTTIDRQANAGSYSSVISANGRYIAFESDASNLVAGDDNAIRDVFLYDRMTGITKRISNIPGYTHHFTPSISEDGRFTVYTAFNNADLYNLVTEIYMYDNLSGTTVNLTESWNGDAVNPVISGDGEHVLFWVRRTWYGPVGMVIDVGPSNIAPIANAGGDQAVEATGLYTDIDLDASGSSDADGDVLTYSWMLDGEVIAEGVSPTVALGVGEHAIQLTVDDGNGETATDTVVVTVQVTTSDALASIINDMLANGIIDNAGIANGLIKKVENGNYKAAINYLNAQSGKHIDSDAADILIGYLENL